MDTRPGMDELCSVLAAEHDAIRRHVVGLDDTGLGAMTPSQGWTIRDQLTHLAFFDEKAVLAAVDPDAFAADVELAFADFDAYEAAHLQRGRTLSSLALIGWWDGARHRLLDLFGRIDPSERLPWYGPPMSARSSATARFMETWAHGLDISDALGVEQPVGDSIRHVCDLGVRTFGFSYVVRGLDPPDVAVRVELVAPSGAMWVWGPENAGERVTGNAVDFAYVVTQRRHRSDTGLVSHGDVADQWMSIAQVFAGPPGPGRAPATR